MIPTHNKNHHFNPLLLYYLPKILLFSIFFPIFVTRKINAVFFSFIYKIQIDR
jgi:hypothetical protein